MFTDNPSFGGRSVTLVHIRCKNHIEVKKFNLILEIDFVRNSSQKHLQCPKGWFGYPNNTQTPC